MDKEFFYVIDSQDETSEALIHKYNDSDQARVEMSRHHVDFKIVGFEEAWMDEWIKVVNKPTDEDLADWCHPLTPDQVTVRKPGTHPGGDMYWIEPAVPIHYPVFEERDLAWQVSYPAAEEQYGQAIDEFYTDVEAQAWAEKIHRERGVDVRMTNFINRWVLTDETWEVDTDA